MTVVRRSRPACRSGGRGHANLPHEAVLVLLRNHGVGLASDHGEGTEAQRRRSLPLEGFRLSEEIGRCEGLGRLVVRLQAPVLVPVEGVKRGAPKGARKKGDEKSCFHRRAIVGTVACVSSKKGSQTGFFAKRRRCRKTTRMKLTMKYQGNQPRASTKTASCLVITLPQAWESVSPALIQAIRAE